MSSARTSGPKVVTAGAAVILVGWAGAAFACSAQPQVYSLLPGSAAPGEKVLVQGQSVAGGAPVEIRWNGVNGPLLAVTTPVGGQVSASVQVPEVGPGIYSLMLVDQNAGVARTAIEVTGAAGSAPAAVSSAALWPTASDATLAASPASATPASAGLVLLGVGLVGLFATATAAVLRRRLVLTGTR